MNRTGFRHGRLGRNLMQNDTPVAAGCKSYSGSDGNARVPD